MSAFLFLDTKISNPEAYEEYKALARPIAEKYGGRYRVRGGDLEIFESTLWTPTRIVIIEFPNKGDAREFLDSEEYGAVKHIRTTNAESTVFLVGADE